MAEIVPGSLVQCLELWDIFIPSCCLQCGMPAVEMCGACGCLAVMLDSGDGAVTTLHDLPILQAELVAAPTAREDLALPCRISSHRAKAKFSGMNGQMLSVPMESASC